MQTNEEKLAEALLIAKKMLDEKNQQIEKLKPLAKYADEVLNSATLHTINSIAVCVGVSAIKMNQFLEEQGWIYREGKDIYPCSKLRGKGLCGYHVVTYAYDIDGCPKTREHLKWTERGKREIIALWNDVHGLLI